MKKLSQTEGLVWLNRHSGVFKKHAGKWIAFQPNRTRYTVGEAAPQALKSFRLLYPSATSPNLFHIPRPDEGPYVLWQF